MGLNSALKDRARLRRKIVGAKVEGRSIAHPVPGEWFKARLNLPHAPQGEDPGHGRRHTSPSPTLLVGIKDLSKELFVIEQSDEVEVDSPQLGRAVWRVSGDPQPIRKKRKVIGYQVDLERLNEPTRESI